MRTPIPSFFLFAIMAFGITACVSGPHLDSSTPSSSPVPPIAPTSTPIIDTVGGDLKDKVRKLEDEMPRANSEGYVIPTRQEQRDFAKLTSALLQDDLADAVSIAINNNYLLRYYIDRGDNKAKDYLLLENNPIQNGWGTYVFRIGSKSNIIVEAPHPLHDMYTPSVALDIYRALGARALLVAGAHRNANGDGSADVAHSTESIFQSVHISLVQEIQQTSGNAVILQIHGFHASKHSGYPQVVLGFGEKIQTSELPIAQELSDFLSKKGIRVGICTGDVWLDLCGTKNAQAAITNGGMFIHVELEEDLRKNDNVLVEALSSVFLK